LLGDGTGYLSGTVAADVTVVSKEGTAIVSIPSANRINVGVGTLWSLALSNGSRYEHPTMISTTVAIMVDVSGNKRHLALTGYTLATAVVESLTTGSDWLNQVGHRPSKISHERVPTPTITTWWTAGGAAITITGGIANVVSATDNLIYTPVLDFSAGKTFVVIIKFQGAITGGGLIECHAGGNSQGAGQNVPNEVGYLNFLVPITGTPNGRLIIGALGTVSCAIESVSIRQLADSIFSLPYVNSTIDALGFNLPARARVHTWGDSFTNNYFTRLFAQYENSENGGVSSETSTQIKTRFLAAGDFTSSAIFWVGFNNRTDLATVRADLNEMVSKMQTNRWLVLSTVSAYTEKLGNATHDAVVAFNAESATLYGNNYYDIRGYMRDQYDPNIPQDVIDYADDCIPNRFLLDGVHFNANGDDVLFPKIYSLLLERSLLSLGNDYLPGRAKYSLLREPIRWPSAPEIIARTGVNNVVYDASGAGITMADDATALAALASLADDQYLWGGDKAAALYSEDKSADAARIKRYVGDTA
jgi:lysophospholipase L1-like esterase